MKSPAQKPIRMNLPQGGHTLIEMLIATIIGLFLILSVVGTFAWSMKNNMQDSSTARMQENARYALEALSKELQMASFMHDAIGGGPVDTTLVVGAFDDAQNCEPWVLKVADSELVSVSRLPGNDPLADYQCLKTENNVRVRALDSAPQTGELTLQTTVDGNSRIIKWGEEGNYDRPQDAPFLVGASNWEFAPSIFFIAENPENVKTLPECGDDFVPTLFRKKPLSSTPKEPEAIAEGIEYFHLMWGVDNEMVDGNAATLPDGYPNYFVSSPTADQLPGIVAAKLFVLARGSRSDGPYTDNKVYTMGDVIIPADTFSDCYHRKVFSTTVRLRNQVIKNVLSTVTS
jgi:type IV pilus assembly protein PilW